MTYANNIIKEKHRARSQNAKTRHMAKRIVYYFIALGEFKLAKNAKRIAKEMK